MVGPIPTAERQLASRRLAAGFVGFVGVSSALTALGGGATTTEVAAVGLAGAVVGLVLLAALRVGR